MIDLARFQSAIRDEGLDGWLFVNFRQRDPLTNHLLGLSTEGIATRPWYYLVPAGGEPLKIVHAIEAGALDSLPGRRELYASRAELLSILSRAPKGRFAAQYSRELPIVSFLDHGTALLLEASGFTLAPSDGLIQRTIGLIDAAGAASHERAAHHLYEIVDLVWKRVVRKMAEGSRPTEGAVQSWILAEFETRGLVFDHAPIVGSGLHSSDPHYEPRGGGSPLSPGEVLQLDLWAKESATGSVYADISWVGFLAPSPTEEVRTVFDAVRRARDRAVSFIRERRAAGKSVSGAEVDAETRAVLVASGYARGIKHRTGHGIDRELHGYGVNLDSVEFPDNRPIIEGSCFSVEPGLYLGDFGMRSEIDVYLLDSELRVSGGIPQAELLLLPGA